MLSIGAFSIPLSTAGACPTRVLKLMRMDPTKLNAHPLGSARGDRGQSGACSRVKLMAFLGQRCAAEGGPGQSSRVFTGLEAKAILEL
jgi:hypothetical protein